ncbi:MAG: hypothetical protein ABSB49_17925 [Polyangia bacterium]|jgi:hypothetical protein
MSQCLCPASGRYQDVADNQSIAWADAWVRWPKRLADVAATILAQVSTWSRPGERGGEQMLAVSVMGLTVYGLVA